MRPSTKIVAGVLLASILGAAGVSLAAGGSAEVYSGCYKATQPNEWWVKLIGENGLPSSCPMGNGVHVPTPGAARGVRGSGACRR
jgi:hypothetical protein